MSRLVASLLTLCLGAGLRAADAQQLLTYNTLPMGTAEAPLVLRTYFPEPDLDPAVFAHHHHGGKSPRYSPDLGTDVAGEYTPVKGVPAAIGVNVGPALSYVFDTVECRLLYAWQGGFVDMFPYWGDEQRGGRISNGYVPPLVGTLFYKTSGKVPVEVNGKSVDELGAPKFVGYDLVKKSPVFITRFGNQTIRTRIYPLDKELGLRMEISAEPFAKLSYRVEDPALNVKQEQAANGVLHVTIKGTVLGTFAGFPRNVNITEASIAAGDNLSKLYACATCHSTDGSSGYGPTWTALFESNRTLADGAVVKVDEAYLRESITAPNAKIAQGFAPNFMPPYQTLKPLEIDSLLLYIKSLKQPD